MGLVCLYNGQMDPESEPPPPSQPYEEAISEVNSVDFLEGIDFSEKEYDGGESDNSIECRDQIREELQYDVDELIQIRKTNLNLRKAPKKTGLALLLQARILKTVCFS